MIKRKLEQKLKQLFRQFPVVTITGPRQAGKTTLIRHVFPKLRYASLEDLDNRDFAEKDPRGFLATYRGGAIIDEAQRVPALFSYIQGEVDRIDKPGLFVLSGSQNFLLHEKISQTLAGRTAILKLLPLGQEEIKGQFQSRPDYHLYLYKGFYPRVHTQKINPSDWYSSYIQTYLERDVRLIKNVSDLGLFQRFTRLCAGRIGQILNLSALAADCGVSHNTARSWISLLEASYIIVLLQPHYRNYNKRLVKMPKLFFLDSGLACYLLGITSPEQLRTHYLKGHLFESMIIAEYFKYRLNRGLEPNLYFWRDKLGHEIDCVIDSGASVVPVEIKSAATVAADFFSGLTYWSKLSGQSPARSFLVYGGDKGEKRSNGEVVSWMEATNVFRGV